LVTRGLRLSRLFRHNHWLFACRYRDHVPGPGAVGNSCGRFCRRHPARAHVGHGKLELGASKSELGERPPGDERGDLAANPSPTLPGSYSVADLGGRLVAVDREGRAVRCQPVSPAVDSVPGGVCPVAPVGAPDAPGARRLDIDHSGGRIPPQHVGVVQHGQCLGCVVLQRTTQQETAGHQLHSWHAIEARRLLAAPPNAKLWPCRIGRIRSSDAYRPSRLGACRADETAAFAPDGSVSWSVRQMSRCRPARYRWQARADDLCGSPGGASLPAGSSIIMCMARQRRPRPQPRYWCTVGRAGLRAGRGRQRPDRRRGARLSARHGELWVDDGEVEVELARLIVDPGERGQGLGRRLAAELARLARSRQSRVFLRIHPRNIAAQRCYAAAGFAPVEPHQAASWNVGQPIGYLWLSLVT